MKSHPGMHTHIQRVKRAANKEEGLEEALDRALADVNLPTEVDAILEAIWEFDAREPRYLRIYDLLHERYPNNPMVPLYKALACHFTNREASVEATIQTLLILHQTDEDYPLIRSCYETLGVQYYRLGRPQKAIAACTMALSYYDPKVDKLQHAIHSGLHLRATIYFEQNQPELAKKDIHYYLSHFPGDEAFHHLLEKGKQGNTFVEGL